MAKHYENLVGIRARNQKIKTRLLLEQRLLGSGFEYSFLVQRHVTRFDCLVKVQYFWQRRFRNKQNKG